jgi:hypothetical protein
VKDPDDTAQVFRIIDALSGNTGERLFHASGAIRPAPASSMSAATCSRC